MSENIAAKEYLAQGGDWQQIVSEAAERGDETVVINFGPTHPSTHGVMRLVIELDGETVKDMRVGIGFLHTGIEKSMEYRTWTQGVAYATRANYVANFFNELVYCLAVEKLLGITDEVRACQRAARHDHRGEPDLLAPGCRGHRIDGAGCHLGHRGRSEGA